MKIISGINDISCAIVKQACEDYFNALRVKRRLERRYFFELQNSKLVATPKEWGGV